MAVYLTSYSDCLTGFREPLLLFVDVTPVWKMSSTTTATSLLPVLAGDTGFMKAAQQLITWLEKGSVDKRSANLFYSLIQSSNTHVRRLVMEKQQHEEELNQAQMLFKQRVQGIIVQCE